MSRFGPRLALALVALATVFLVHRSDAAWARKTVQAAGWAVTANIPSEGVLTGWLKRLGVVLPAARPNPQAHPSPDQKLPVIVWPMAGAVVTPFGTTSQGGASVDHTMIEVRAPAGTPVRSASSGVVLDESKTALGELVKVGDGPYTFLYRGLGSVKVRTGYPVKRGETLGLLYHQGPGNLSELGFEVEAGSTPIDPASLLPPMGGKGN